MMKSEQAHAKATADEVITLPSLLCIPHYMAGKMLRMIAESALRRHGFYTFNRVNSEGFVTSKVYVELASD